MVELISLLGLYDSLRTGCPLESCDVEAAINSICDESLPLEINITKFIQSTCRYTQLGLEATHSKQVAAEATTRSISFDATTLASVSSIDDEIPEDTSKIERYHTIILPLLYKLI